MKRGTRWWGIGVLSMVGIMVGIVAALLLYPQAPGGGDRTEPTGGPIALPSTRGDFSLAQLGADQLAVVVFGYTLCPDVCPMSLAVVRQVLQGLDAGQRARVVPVMISLDPERDSLERLAEYLTFFGDDFIGATGSPAQLEAVTERYGVVWRKVETPDSAIGYTLDHSASLFLVDRHGQIRRRVLHAPTPGPLQVALDETLAEG